METVEEEVTIKPDIPVSCRLEKIKITPPNPSAGYSYTAIARICKPTPVPGDPKQHWVGPYASFIVQRLDIGNTRIIMLDTSDYEKPFLAYVAFTGDLSRAQVDAAKSLLSTDAFDRRTVIMLCHHPLKVIREKRRKWIIQNAGRYISAHTHYSASRIEHSSNRRKTLELNIGSTLDYPPQAVIARLDPTAMSFRVVGAKTKWSGFLAPCETEQKRKQWRDPLSSLYKDYKRDLYVRHLLTALKKAAAIAPSNPALEIPSGDKDGDWLLLERALQTINASEGESRLFWACQAYYASEATKDEKSWWERFPKFGWGFRKGEDVTITEGWYSLISP